MTAIHNSRGSLRRLVQRQSEIEAEIEKEQKQAARLEWLLHRVSQRGGGYTSCDDDVHSVLATGCGRCCCVVVAACPSPRLTSSCLPPHARAHTQTRRRSAPTMPTLGRWTR